MKGLTFLKRIGAVTLSKRGGSLRLGPLSINSRGQVHASESAGVMRWRRRMR